jgi:hypothetical protein
MADLSTLRICPGCGTVDPASVWRSFGCTQCGWEADDCSHLPTLAEWAAMDPPARSNDVNLTAYARAILEAANV